MTVDYRNFQLNSNKPTDSIIFSYEGTIQNTGSGIGYYSIELPHTFNFKPLPFGIFSLDNGTTWQDINVSGDFANSSYGGYTYGLQNTILVTINYYGANPPASVKVRVFAFAPDNYIGNPPTAISNFYINSNYIADTLQYSGYKVISSNNQPTQLQAHNLGYIPRCICWEEYDTAVIPIAQSTIQTGMAPEYRNYIYITTSGLYFDFYSPGDTSTKKVHYRIYGGQNG